MCGFTASEEGRLEQGPSQGPKVGNRLHGSALASCLSRAFSVRDRAVTQLVRPHPEGQSKSLNLGVRNPGSALAGRQLGG